MLKALLEENTGVALDLENAYNSLARDKMLEALYAEPRFEPIFRLVDWAYSSPTNLYVRGAERSPPPMAPVREIHLACFCSAWGC